MSLGLKYVGESADICNKTGVASPVSLCICNWQNVLGTHHASAHGGSSDLIVKMLD